MSSLDLKTATESLLRTVFGSEFQTAGADQRKAHVAKNTIFVLTSIVFLVYDKVVGSYCCQKQDFTGWMPFLSSNTRACDSSSYDRHTAR